MPGFLGGGYCMVPFIMASHNWVVIEPSRFNLSQKTVKELHFFLKLVWILFTFSCKFQRKLEYEQKILQFEFCYINTRRIEFLEEYIKILELLSRTTEWLQYTPILVELIKTQNNLVNFPNWNFDSSCEKVNNRHEWQISYIVSG